MKCKAFAKLIPTIVCAPYVADFDPLKGYHDSGSGLPELAGFVFYKPADAERTLWGALHGMDSSSEPTPDREVVVEALREFAADRRRKAALLPLPRILACGHYSRSTFWADVETAERGVVRVVGESAYGWERCPPTLAHCERAQPQVEPHP